ncbi:hypothetical protein ACFVQB_14130 [Paenibacillus sp. NPDC057886]|uniref:hypothetical protein n=1 Tax=Paenibacillus sp. NPDC057886 TaxID=3346270 RepID=UPI0036C1E786
MLISKIEFVHVKENTFLPSEETVVLSLNGVNIFEHSNLDSRHYEEVFMIFMNEGLYGDLANKFDELRIKYNTLEIRLFIEEVKVHTLYGEISSIGQEIGVDKPLKVSICLDKEKCNEVIPIYYSRRK